MVGEFFETRIAMQWIEERINFNNIDDNLFCFVASLQPIYCLVLITEGRMDCSVAVSKVSRTLALFKISQLT